VSTLRELVSAVDLGPDNPTPIYLRLQEGIKAAVERGDLKPLEALPGERDLAETFGVSRVTIRKALAGLIDSGLLRHRQGSGTFVASRPKRVEQALSHLTSFSDDMRLRGLTPSVVWLIREVSLCAPREAMRLSLSPSETVCRLKRLRLASGAPMAIETAVVATRYLPSPDLVDESLYAALDKRGVRPVRALQTLSAANLGEEEAQLLDVKPGSAALAIDRLSFLPNGAPIEFTHSWYRGDAYDFVAELTLRTDEQ
jgi:GntR family transcriptional regulator